MQATIRRAKKRLLQMHFESRVGHIGGNLSALDAMIVLQHSVMHDGDVFVLAKGHAAGALYVTLWSVGRLSEEDLSTFHGEGTHLAAHPAPGWLREIPFATGSLGHGLPAAAGMALGYKLQNRPGRIYCLTSDGEWQEGSNWEALIFAQHHQLNNLTVLIDENRLQGFGTTREVASMDPLDRKIAGFSLELTVVNGHDAEALREALEAPVRIGPRFIVLKTVKGHGVSFMENAMEWHYLPMSQEQYSAAIQEIDSE
jgi:transketolase